MAWKIAQLMLSSRGSEVLGAYQSGIEYQQRSTLTTTHPKITSKYWSSSHTEEHAAVKPAYAMLGVAFSGSNSKPTKSDISLVVQCAVHCIRRGECHDEDERTAALKISSGLLIIFGRHT